MAKNKKLPIATATMTIVYAIPTYVATTVCPHCNELSFDEIIEKQNNRTILNKCSMCDKEYFIEVPKFSKSKK